MAGFTSTGPLDLQTIGQADGALIVSLVAP